jgi:16S rRNA (adenine1518-N6/adenine1519-N6)-dimethyltransferase
LTCYDQKKTLVVGNLPYYITSPIFRKCFEENSFLGGVFLIQKEVATKIMTEARKKSYLRWLLNNHYKIDYCFTVAASAFTPPPKVESAVVRFKIQDVKCKADEYTNLLELLDIISSYKRKTLGKIAKMTGIKIPEEYQGLRLEELGWEEMLRIIQNDACKM